MTEFTYDFSEAQLNPQYWILNNDNDYWESMGQSGSDAYLDTENQRLALIDHEAMMNESRNGFGSATLFGFDLSSGFSLDFKISCASRATFRVFLSNTTDTTYFLNYAYNNGNPILSLVKRENQVYEPINSLNVGGPLDGIISINATLTTLTVTYDSQSVYNGNWDGPSQNGVVFVSYTSDWFIPFDTTIDNLDLQTVSEANFTENVTVGTVPLTVQFTDTSTNNPTSWFWNFGDGNTSNEQSPEHTYQEVGTYDVTLTVANESIQATVLKSRLIEVYPVLVSVPSSSPERGGIVPTTVQFTEESGNDKINSWYWDFGDGTTSEEQNPVHTYNTSGTYNVLLRVSDGVATVDNDSSKLIIVTEPIVVDFTTDVIEGENPLTVHFTNLSENANNYLWNFGDGTVSMAENPTHTYVKSGIYNIQLKSSNEIESKYEIKNKLITVGVDFQFKPQTQTLKTQGRYPEFGLLKSEIFSYLGVIPEIIPMSNYFLIYDKDKWDCGKVWAGGDYTFGVFYVDIPITNIPSNINLLTQEELQIIIDKCIPFGTKGIPRYIHKKRIKIGVIMTANIQGGI